MAVWYVLLSSVSPSPLYYRHHNLSAQVYEFLLGIPPFSRRPATTEPDVHHLAQIIKFTAEEFSPALIKSYKLAPQFLDMDTGACTSRAHQLASMPSLLILSL